MLQLSDIRRLRDRRKPFKNPTYAFLTDLAAAWPIMSKLFSLFLVTSSTLAQTDVSSAFASVSTSGAPTVTVSTAVPSPTLPLNATIPP